MSPLAVPVSSVAAVPRPRLVRVVATVPPIRSSSTWKRVVGLKKVRTAPPQPRVPSAGAGAERDARIVVGAAEPPVHLEVVALTIPPRVEGALPVARVVGVDHAHDRVPASIRLGD